MADKLSAYSFIIGILLLLGYGYFFINYRSFLPLFISIAYLCFYKFNSTDEYEQLFRTSFIMVFISSLIVYFIYTVYFFHPKEWDFTCFYLYGNVAASGLNFYNPQDFHAILRTINLPLQLSDGFIREVIDVGCPYPPPTLLLFSTLGFMSFEKAFAFWFVLNHLFLIGSIILLKKIFFENSGIPGIIISIILIISLNASLYTNQYSQIVFILLFVLLLIYKFKEKPISGLYLALAVFLKPFAAILFLYFIATRQMRTVLVFILSCLGICLFTAVFFGFQPFIEYLVNNPTLREPAWLFTETTNQSLLAELLRLFPDNQTLAKSFYSLFTIILLIVVSRIIYIKRKENESYEIFFPILLSLSLIIYPSGQFFYSVVHILSILILLRYFKNLDISVLIIFIFYLLSYAGLLYLNIFILILSIIVLFKTKYITLYSNIRTSVKFNT